ncbi:MAG: sulfotransferase family 2 domain-containing protein [Paenirhodobacter sp.]|uniref:sulfotransferase family 2 domain-containing protein n=1 Tax=Paenirhodobacter sp. TaxID=1965326 RepID=UPI003D0BB662
MSFRLLTIRFDPARLILVVIPKSGSTTLISAFLILAGLGEQAATPRQFRRSEGSAALMAERGLAIDAIEREALAQLRSDLPDYRFVTVMRDPAQRFLSGYFSKINRFCKRFAKPVYYWGKLCQAFEGPKAWGDVNRGNAHMLRHVSFERFVAGFEEHGTEWDSHFALQSRMIGLAEIGYDRVIPLETLDADLPRILAELGVAPEVLARLTEMPRMNRTAKDGDGRQALLTPEMRARIAALYREDYDSLGPRA